MFNRPRTNHYSFHGLHLTISGDNGILAALHARLRHFSAEPQVPVDVAFEFQRVASPRDHAVTIPAQTRPVYESQQGHVVYADSEDHLFINYRDQVRAGCDPQGGHVQVSIAGPETDNLWLISHPMFTIPLIECVKRRGLYNVHAAGVCLHGKGILLPGASGSGKSTLSLILTRAGFTFLSDDMLFLKGMQPELRVLAFPDEIDVTDHTVELLPELHQLRVKAKAEGWAKRQFLIEDVYDTAFLAEVEPAALVFPKVTGVEQSVITPIDNGEALLALAPNILLTSAPAAQAHLSILSQLARTTKCYRLDVGRDLDRLPFLLVDILQ